MENKENRILPNLIVVNFDETHLWKDEIQEKAKKIFGYYLINISEITHCAELAGSYYCYSLYNRVENTEEFIVKNSTEQEYSDELFEIENNTVDDDPNMYINENTKLNIIDDSYCKNIKPADIEEQIIEYGLESFIEYYKCNPVE